VRILVLIKIYELNPFRTNGGISNPVDSYLTKISRNFEKSLTPYIFFLKQSMNIYSTNLKVHS